MKADLHVHTDASDGSLSPGRVVGRAVSRGLAAIAITDHDTVMGIPRALRAGHAYGVKVIPGVELSTEVEEQEYHILGYFIDYTDPGLRNALAGLRRARYLRIKEMTKRVKDLGFQVSWARVKEVAGRGAVGRPHLARVLVEKGYISSTSQAFIHLIGRGCPAYVPRPKLTPSEAIRIIRRAGGVPVLAHPGWVRRGAVRDLAEAGLMGLELYYPSHNKRTTRRLYRLAKRYRLACTGGSDYHGANRDGIDLGSVVVTEEEVALLERIRLSL